MTNTKFAEISDNLEFLENWEDRYKYLIELGQSLLPLSDDERTPENKVHGCVSQVWLSTKAVGTGDARVLQFRGDSDAMIVKGLVAVLIALFSGASPKQITETDAIGVLDNLGLREHLTAQRSNGLIAMVERMQTEARSHI